MPHPTTDRLMGAVGSRLGLHSRRQGGGHNEHERTISQEQNGGDPAGEETEREDFFREDERGDRGQRHDIHHAKRKKNNEEQPAAAHAIEAVLHAHPKRASITIAPRRKNESHWSTTFHQTDTFYRRELIYAGQYQRNPTDTASVVLQPRNARGERIGADGERIGQ